MEEPGASAMGGCLSLPMGGGLRRWPPWALAQGAQSSHQEPWSSVAPPTPVSGSGWFSSVVQWRALGLGGVTMPAMWPEELSTNRALPLTSWVVLYDDVQGVMWSVTAPTRYRSSSTASRFSRTPASSISPRGSWLSR